MQVKEKLYYCVAGNFASLALVLMTVAALNDGTSPYFRWGPNDKLMLISVQIDTWARWTLALLFIGMLRVCDVWVNEIGSPVLSFNIYNPDKRRITDFTKNELQLLANSMWFIDAVRNVFMTVIAVTQIDLAFASVLMSQIASVFTVRLLLNEKTFERDRTVSRKPRPNYDAVDVDDVL